MPFALTPTVGCGDAPALGAIISELVTEARARVSVPARMRNARGRGVNGSSWRVCARWVKCGPWTSGPRGKTYAASRQYCDS